MSKKRSLWLRLLAAAVALGLMVLLAVMTMAFTGDPISAHLADKAAKKYVIASDTYRTMDLELTDAVYNFKFSEYLVRASSRTNPDIHFEIYCQNGKVTRDSYQYDVIENGNVQCRYADEYAILLKVRLEQAGLGGMNLFVELDHEKAQEVDWYPGMPFDPYLPIVKSLQLYPSMEEVTIETAADCLTGVAKVLTERGYEFTHLGLYDFSDETGGQINVDNIPVERALEPGFAAYLTELSVWTEENPDLPKTEEGEDPPYVSYTEKRAPR